MRVAALILLLGAAGAAQDLHPLDPAALEALPLTLAPAARQQLLAAGSLSSSSKGQAPVDLCPDPEARAELARILAAAHPDIGIQSLVLAPMPLAMQGRPDRALALYNRLHRFRSMAGIPYFSSTRGRYRTLFTSSQLVRAAQDRTALADPEFPGIEPRHGFLLEQDDTTFGRNLYAVTVTAYPGGAMALTMSNLERVTWGFIPVLAPAALHLTLVVKPSADGRYLCFYGNVAITSGRGLLMADQVRTSFTNRILAISAWYGSQVSGS